MRVNTIVFAIAITDIIIAIFLIVYNALQVAYIVWNEFRCQDTRIEQVLPIVIPSWAFSISINFMQIYVAIQLLKVTTIKMEFDASYFLENTKLWVRASSFFNLILSVKLCLAILVKRALCDSLIYFWGGTILLIISEIIFRIIAAQYVRRFIDKLPNVRRIDVHSLHRQSQSNLNLNIHTLCDRDYTIAILLTTPSSSMSHIAVRS